MARPPREFFCTDPRATAADVPGLVADRFTPETCFRDVKGGVGAGQQQVRRLRAKVGAFHVRLWGFTMTEAWAWNRPAEELVAHRGRVTAGLRAAPPEPRGQTSGVAAGTAGRRH
ncbi:MAG TPA: hypothetical protein VGE74_05955 [Gemmata sp.]